MYTYIGLIMLFAAEKEELLDDILMEASFHLYKSRRPSHTPHTYIIWWLYLYGGEWEHQE